MWNQSFSESCYVCFLVLKNKIQLNRFGDLVGFIKLFTNWTASVIQQMEVLLGVVKQSFLWERRWGLELLPRGRLFSCQDFFLRMRRGESEEAAFLSCRLPHCTYQETPGWLLKGHIPGVVWNYNSVLVCPVGGQMIWACFFLCEHLFL